MSKRVSNKRQCRKTPARSFQKRNKWVVRLAQARAALRLAAKHYIGGQE